MKIFDLREAAAFLRMNPETLRQKAKAGVIPGAKSGRCWVFLEEDLVTYLRSQYAVPAEPVRVTELNEEEVCHFTVEARRGGSASPRPTVKEYEAALGLKTV